jgi:glycosyltransferase involved in cell wall biosynthesis
MTDDRPPAVLFAVTEDWYFWAHRKPLADYLHARGCDISVATRVKDFRSRLSAAGFNCIAMNFERSLRYPWRDVRVLFTLPAAITRHDPDIVHLVSLKPILLSAMALLSNRRTRFVAAFTGMGYLFSTTDRGAHWLQSLVVAVLRALLQRPNCWVIVQNADDLALLRSHRLGDAARTILIPGSGVDTQAFAYREVPLSATPLVVLPARLIRDKGIAEFVAAAERTRAAIPGARFALVGAADPDNPAAIDAATIERWTRSGIVEWWGHRADMAAVYHAAQIVCLPSYREGLPKVLLEAAACGRPLVAADVAGCREVCIDGLTGTLVAPRSIDALASALIAMLRSPDMQLRYGLAARALVERHFSLELIAGQTLAFYQQISAKRSVAPG